LDDLEFLFKSTKESCSYRNYYFKLLAYPVVVLETSILTTHLLREVNSRLRKTLQIRYRRIASFRFHNAPLGYLLAMACVLFVTLQLASGTNHTRLRGSWSHAPSQRLSKYSSHSVRKTRRRCVLVKASGGDKRSDSTHTDSSDKDDVDDWDTLQQELKGELDTTNNGDSDDMIEASSPQANEEEMVQEHATQVTGENTQPEFGDPGSADVDNRRVDESSDNPSSMIQLTEAQPEEGTRPDMESRPDSKYIKGTASGGLFKLSPDQSPANESIDERTKQITNAWTNESGYLIGIGIIVLIGCFYVYVWTHQGGRY
jgi:hypothetical protein